MAKRSEQQKQRYLQIVEQYSTLIYKVCYMYADDAEHLKDLRQEVLANLWQGLEGYNGNARMSTWIYRVAINTCITFFRRHGKHSSLERIDERAASVADNSGERASQLRQMYEMIGRLGKIDKALIMLWLDEHSYDEIADVTGMSRGNVASRLYRIKQRLIAENHG